MSYIFLEDPDPGRCLNFRAVPGSIPPQSVRCLDYEDNQHLCVFPKTTLQRVEAFSSRMQSKRLTKPEPWKKPDEDSS